MVGSSSSRGGARRRQPRFAIEVSVRPDRHPNRRPGGKVAARGKVAAKTKRAGHTGFKSKKQWRYFFANPKLRRYAHQKAHATAGGPKARYRRLPTRTEDRPLWATAMYAGLRRGELLALRWEDVDLAGGVIDVVRSWDMVEGPIAPKSVKGTRKVPIPSVLRALLVEHRLRSGGHGMVFGTGDSPFRPDDVRHRADAAWEAGRLKRITLHECRHTFASLMIAAGCNAKALSTYMGHANIAITMDRYGHLMPGNEEEAAGLLDAYLLRSVTPTVTRTPQSQS